MRSGRNSLAGAAMLLLAGCAGSGGRETFRPVADLPVRIGSPYVVRGRRYVPADAPRYDAVGYASWYGAESGRRIANGERFDPARIGAAHRTLPLPCYVEVTALRTGRTILVRVNDRGPFDPARIIDLSRGAARMLGIEREGIAPVRVRRVFPSEADRAAMRAGRPVAARVALDPVERAMLLRRIGAARDAGVTMDGRLSERAAGPSDGPDHHDMEPVR